MAKAEIPILDFSKEAASGSVGSDEKKRRELSNKVREACESHGCFLLMYDDHCKIPRQEFFLGLKALFDLPEETKTKYVSPKPYRSYSGKSPIVPFYQSFGLDEAQKLDQVQAFTNLMWPRGNSSFW